MNTPEPCFHCGNLYYDPMTKHLEDGYVECMDRSGEAKWGKKDCLQCTTNKWWEKDSDKGR